MGAISAATLENHVRVLPFGPAIPLLGTYPKEMKIHCYTKTSAWVFISSIIYSSQKVETTQMSTICHVDKQNMLDPYNGIILG